MFQRLEEATRDPPGVTRAAYGPGEQFAHDLVRREGEALGAEARVDAAGNLYLTLPGRIGRCRRSSSGRISTAFRTAETTMALQA